MLFRFKEVDSPLCSYCNEEEEIPLHLFHIVRRGVLTPYFMKTPPPYIANPSFFKFCPTPPPPPSLSPPAPIPTAHSVAIFLWLNGLSI